MICPEVPRPKLPRPEVAIALLHHDGQFLLQLRDNIPTIVYPGHWAFFGGHLEPGESADVAIRRELLEEIGYAPPHLIHFRSYTEDPKVIRHVYWAKMTVGLDMLNLQEGWDMGWFTLEHIHQGSRYSEKAARMCPLGKPHQQILLDFLNEKML
jgi:8-oxo-dGTP diphosphatase